MADQDNNDTAGHNVGARAEVIRKGYSNLLSIDAEIAAAKEKHLEPLTKERTKLWRTLKKDVDIPRKVLELDYKKLKLAKEADDDSLTLDHLREVHNALHPGGQVDWIAALNADAPAADKKAA